MSSMRAVGAALAAPESYPSSSQSWESHTVKCTVHWGRAGAVLAAEGEIDAVNANSFADYVRRCADCCEWLILDLSRLTFLGVSGFSALQSINARCAKSQLDWVMVPGPAVATLLRVCDPQSRLPLAESLTAALATVQKSSRRLLRSVP